MYKIAAMVNDHVYSQHAFSKKNDTSLFRGILVNNGESNQEHNLSKLNSNIPVAKFNRN